MDENKEKSTGGDLKEEMDELARIFKEELDKAVKDAEDAAEIDDLDKIEVEGYNPKTLSLDKSRKREHSAKDELCECCGERPRGTAKNPSSPFCKECEAIMEKYPYDRKGIIGIAVTACLALAAIICFIINVPLFSALKEGDRAAAESRLYTAERKYETALSLLPEEEGKNYLNPLAKYIILEYRLLNVNMGAANNDINKYFSDARLKLPQFREIEKIKNEIASLTATSYAVDAHIMKFDPEDEASYDKVIAELDSLVGKKIYKLRNGKYIDETDASYTPDGSEEVTVYDEGYLCFFKYSTAFTMEKDNDVLTAFLCETVEKSPSLAPVVTPLLARTYVLGGQYDKAQELADKQKSINTEGADYYIISSMISRYRDGDFQKSAALCDEGLNMISSLPGGDMLIQRFGYKLSFHKALALIMLQENSDAKNYSDAYKIVDGCQRLLTEGQRQVEIQIRDLYAMLALATGDDEAYENLESMIENYPDDSVPFSEDVKDYKDGKKTLAEIVSSGRYDLL